MTCYQCITIVTDLLIGNTDNIVLL